MMKKLFAFTLLLLIATAPTMAEDKIVEDTKQLDEKTYKPPYCDFTASFPDEPYAQRRCEGDTDDTCYNLVSYNKVFDNMDSSIRVEIICNPSSAEMYKQFDDDAMKTTVKAMSRDSVIESYEINSREDENGKFRQAALLGKGRVGVKDSIYIAQLWSSPVSMMSVEAEMAGESIPEADAMFAEILRSIGYLGVDDDADVSNDRASETSASTNN